VSSGSRVCYHRSPVVLPCNHWPSRRPPVWLPPHPFSSSSAIAPSYRPPASLPFCRRRSNSILLMASVTDSDRTLGCVRAGELLEHTVRHGICPNCPSLPSKGLEPLDGTLTHSSESRLPIHHSRIMWCPTRNSPKPSFFAIKRSREPLNGIMTQSSETEDTDFARTLSTRAPHQVLSCTSLLLLCPISARCCLETWLMFMVVNNTIDKITNSTC
jgi:hypothetical protein